MGNLKKKGESGAAKNFITRNQALKKLQVTLADFRRLCILKGIYPREPRNKKKANKGSTAPTTFYYTKDIAYLLHEPVLNKFRAHKIFARKLTKALGKGEYNTAKTLEENKPSYTLDHIIKERYPTFIDALRDLDDALSMLFLFATMPTTDKVSAPIIQNCDRLCREFEHYVIRSNSLRKVFLSIKGIYYQAEIKGQDITWLVPYKFSQQIPTDVDLRIMLTFLELHQTFVGFVNYRLFTELGLVYPPKIDTSMEDEAGGLGSLEIRQVALGESDPTLLKPKKISKQIASLDMAQIAKHEADKEGEETQDKIDAEEDTSKDNDEIDDFSTVAPNSTEEAPVVQQTTSASLNLFVDFTFYLSREVPRFSLEFVIKSFGGKVSWDPILGGGSPLKEDDRSITHHICDRPTQDLRRPGRTYVQPQWVYDCINKGQLQRVDSYSPGATLPPHLSPFVKAGAGVYDPEEVLEVASEDEAEDEDEVENGDEDVDIDVDNDEKPTDDLKAAAQDMQDELESEDIVAAENQAELEAEAAGISYSEAQQISAKSSKKRSRPSEPVLSAAEKTEKEEKELKTMMMPKRAKKLYEKMQHSNKAKENEINALRQKRKKLAKAKK